jgi:glycosyltransferase involved in cell wall biosynthesis
MKRGMTPATGTTQRLCIVTPAHSSTTAGGSEFQIDCLLEALIPQQRFEIYYLTSFVSDESITDAYRIVRIGDGVRAPRFGYLAHAAPLYRALSNLRPNVIYQRVAGGYSGISAHYARRHGARFVWHIAHDSDVVPDASLEGRNPLRRYLEKRSVEYAIRHADCIIAQTAYQSELLQRNYGRQADAVIPNFQPQPRESIDKSGPPTVLWIASLKPWKQPEAFVALATALRELPGVRFVMVGPWAAGSGERRWMESLAARIQAATNLEYLGPRSQAEVNELLAHSHVFVNTSRYEGFPNTFIQAWSREVAIVSLHVDPDNLLSKEQLGVFCNGSEERLAAAVRDLITQPASRLQLAARGREHARSRHSLANAHQLADLLDRKVAA